MSQIRRSVYSPNWPQEPDDFNQLKFGSPPEEIQTIVKFERCVIADAAMKLLVAKPPYFGTADPICATTHFDYCGTNMSAALLFTAEDGLSCILARFPTSAFENVRLSFIANYGVPHDPFECFRKLFLAEVERARLAYDQSFSGLRHLRPPFSEEEYLKSIFGSFEPSDSLVWQGNRIRARLSARGQERPNHAEICIATTKFMQQLPAWQTLRVMADLTPVFIKNKQTPIDEWAEEPGGFQELTLGMPKDEVEKHVELRNCAVVKYGNTSCEVGLRVGELEVPGTVLFAGGKLAIISGEFDRSKWNYVRSVFVSLYSDPHVEQVTDHGEDSNLEVVDWWGKKIWLRLIASQNESSARFHFQQNYKNTGGKICSSFEVTSVE
jgi:hypothetical protein